MRTPRRRFAPRLAQLVWLAVPLLLWWVLRAVRPAEVWAALRQLGPGQIVVLFVLNALTLLAFSGRWWVILRAQGYSVPYLTLTRYRVASFGVSYFTVGPQLGGEPLQVYLLQRNHGVPGPVAVASTILDKVLELLVNFTFLAFGLWLIAERRIASLVASPQVFAALLLAMGLPLAFLASAWWGWSPFTRLLERVPARFAQAPLYRNTHAVVVESERQIAEFCRTQPRAFVLALLVSVVSWGLIFLEYWLSLSFLGLNLAPWQLVVALTFNRLAFLVPLPGGLGALESSQVLAMRLLGCPPAIGVSQSLIIRARDVVVGLLGLWWGGQAARRQRASFGS